MEDTAINWGSTGTPRSDPKVANAALFFTLLALRYPCLLVKCVPSWASTVASCASFSKRASRPTLT